MAKVLFSACLLGCKVRYNASDLNVTNSDFEKLTTLHYIISFCPEVSAGMTIPRPPAEIAGGDGFDVLSGVANVIEESGATVTQTFITAAKNTLAQCQVENIQFAVFVESSPSCGSHQI